MHINRLLGCDLRVGHHQLFDPSRGWITFTASDEQLTEIKMEFRTRYVVFSWETLEVSIKDETTEEDVTQYRKEIYKIRERNRIEKEIKAKQVEESKETKNSPRNTYRESATKRRIRNSPRHNDGMPMMYSEEWYEMERRMNRDCDCDD